MVEHFGILQNLCSCSILNPKRCSILRQAREGVAPAVTVAGTCSRERLKLLRQFRAPHKAAFNAIADNSSLLAPAFWFV
eukprot:CAMPEP_0172368396 /NCGR_PEP_ID=MMETSP1060-20121228/26963_1 /TAXON_ID=37318 /ORGANISM="Pseudo-nitzschia pungens, Strain cf. cingulata" /LENGTH=78 /DNA_ID=CAMNT_0013092973 /DNA_START=27 /DNA_END=259 /DNA_ORIENTATION=+